MIPHEILIENARRNAAVIPDPDPVAGDPADPDRRPFTFGGRTYMLPSSMLADPRLLTVGNERDLARLRFKHDFPFWAVTCVVINDKITARDIPFRLNRPQRRLVSLLERERRAGRPLRLIMLKARQWGGSTLIQIYFAWIQIIHCRNWNSLICAHVKDTAATIRGMYTKLLTRYPEEYWEEETRPEFRPFERMTNTRFIPGRECKVTVCSSENQESTRGQDCALAHLSEVAFWKDSPLHNPADLLRSVTSGIASKPLSFIAMESTANGVGNFFHREWLRASRPGGSDKLPFFVPWHEIGMNRTEITDPDALWESMDDYERSLWSLHGCTLEAIKWYHDKRLGFPDHRSMMAEYPTTPDEAFASTARSVFASTDVEALRASCMIAAERGEVIASACGDAGLTGDARFQPSADGLCEMWCRPRRGGDYIACVDIGGRTREADFSVICVMDRHSDSGDAPEVVAQWRGHIDHDLLARKAAAIGRFYNDALLVIESNSWESSSEGHGRYLLDMLSAIYPNLYHRPSGQGGEAAGFHTNVRTKAAIVANLVAYVRDRGYVERSTAACDELLQYESLPDGSYAASRGCHDDMLMTRAIALYIHASTRAVAPFHFTERTFHTLLSRCIR
ncbi:MAG: hypothetical protein K2G41_07495 [Duncaniella sp.]|uniref:hypothetical protein n=1 Tax=Duncaniella sp. TaxID=2518496 RepID=UPI0023D547C8|nr:hypothetical protein [Duncaniella sp.]MDE6090532.1 hypothetical protein [Duncaniella sp.]